MTFPIVLLDERGEKHRVPPGGPMVQVRGVGTFDRVKLESGIGRRIHVGAKSFWVLRASGRDLQETLDRGAQVIAPKDLASILYEADIVPGTRVVEAGAGSGAMTITLARSVGTAGHVTTYDLREDFLSVARANVDHAGVSQTVEFRVADIRAGIPERDFDAAVIDIPDPWSAIPAAWEALRPCGYLATFSPNMEQVKETVAAIRKLPFVEVRTIELIEREMEVREIGVRPSFAPLGHTGYLTFARKVLDTF